MSGAPATQTDSSPMPDARLAEIKAHAVSLTYQPTKQAADDLIAMVEHLRGVLTLIKGLGRAKKQIHPGRLAEIAHRGLRGDSISSLQDRASPLEGEG